MKRAATRLALDVRICSRIGAQMLTDIPNISKQAKRRAADEPLGGGVAQEVASAEKR